MIPFLSKPFEYWPNQMHQIPFWVFVALRCAQHGLRPLHIMKANTAMPSGGMHFVSKYTIQENLGLKAFPATLLLAANASEKASQIQAFGEEHGYPLFVKPDSGMTGRGMKKIASVDDIERVLPIMNSDDYLVQAYVPGDFEYGVFWVRIAGTPQIVGINQKHYPSVLGDGVSDIRTLALAEERYTESWNSFLKDMDTSLVPKLNEKVFLSRIGSHTLGCRFSDETPNIKKQQLREHLLNLFPEGCGYDYGRLDIKALSVEDLEKGCCTIIEANGVASQPTHMFDPSYEFGDALGILWNHANWLVKAAAQNRKHPMEIPTLPAMIQSLSETTNAMKRLQKQGETL